MVNKKIIAAVGLILCIALVIIGMSGILSPAEKTANTQSDSQTKDPLERMGAKHAKENSWNRNTEIQIPKNIITPDAIIIIVGLLGGIVCAYQIANKPPRSFKQLNPH